MDYEWPKITPNTTMEELRTIHQRIWDYAIENGKKPHTPYIHNCVGCEYCSVMRTVCHTECLIIWPDGLMCWKRGSLYDIWCDCKDPEIARQIRDLPFKPDGYFKDLTQKNS